MKHLRITTPSPRGGHPQDASGEVSPARLRRVPTWSRKFLSSVAKLPDISRACKHARISRQTAYRWREQDPEFAAKWQEALDGSLDELEGVAFSLAKRGDQQLLTWLLRSHRPQIYRETSRQEHAVLGRIVLIPAKAEGDE